MCWITVSKASILPVLVSLQPYTDLDFIQIVMCSFSGSGS